MAKKSAAIERQPAQISFESMKMAIPKINRRIAELKSLNVQTLQSGSDPQLMALTQKIDALLIDLFGNNTHEYFKYHPYAELRVMSLLIGGEDIGKTRRWAQEHIERAATMLETIKESFAESLEDAGISGTSVKAIKAYEGLELHPTIASAVSPLFRDGHYANAIEDAVKSLNDIVRIKTRIDDDGVSLMNRTFSPKKPVLQFNPLSDECDRNEQKGFMEWFTGTVTGLRNPRAHKIIKDDPEMALEFIAFISLLAKLVDKATVNNSAAIPTESIV